MFCVVTEEMYEVKFYNMTEFSSPIYRLNAFILWLVLVKHHDHSPLHKSWILRFLLQDIVLGTNRVLNWILFENYY